MTFNGVKEWRVKGEGLGRMWVEAWGLFRLLRPVNALLALVGTAVAAWLAGAGRQDGPLVVHTALSALCIGGWGNVVNDIIDLPIDRVNRPQRPLPSGQVRVGTARLWAGVLAIAGLGLSFTLPPLCIGIALVSVVLLFFYSARWKRGPGLGNVVTAAIVGLVFVYGAGAVGRPLAGVVPAILAFFLNLVREITKDLEDRDGDAAVGANTLALRWGEQATLRLVRILLGCTAVLVPLPALLGMFSSSYLVLTGATILPGLVASVVLLRGSPTRKRYSHLSLLLKVLMFLGLAAMVVGGKR